MSIGCTHKLFDFSVSYAILNLSLSILCLPIVLLVPCTFPAHSSLPLPLHENPPCDVHSCDYVPVLVVCLVCFIFVLGSVVDRCEFVVILLFIFLIIFFFLDKSL